MRRLFFALLVLVMPAPLTATPADGCPAPTGKPARLAFAAAELARPHYTDVIAGGRLDLAGCPRVEGEGRVTPEPDFDVLIADQDRPLEFRTMGACDTVLLVATRDGWFYDDDGAGGGDASLRLMADDGRYHVWIGTFGPASCRARLIVEAAR